MFNGRDLTGWDGKPGWWSGRGRHDHLPEHPRKALQGVQLPHLERTASPATSSCGSSTALVGGNSGIQLRSLAIPNWDTRGYQADIDASGQWTGALFEHARAGIAMRGEKVVVDEDGTKHVTALGDPDELASTSRRTTGTTTAIVARGNRITLSINGVTMSDTTDNDKAQAARRGIIALQMHPGPSDENPVQGPADQDSTRSHDHDITKMDTARNAGHRRGGAGACPI